jgi:hypothetical protein
LPEIENIADEFYEQVQQKKLIISYNVVTSCNNYFLVRKAYVGGKFVKK